MRLFVIEFDNAEGVGSFTVTVADNLPTLEEASEILKAGEDTDFTDIPTYIWELGQAWSKSGKMYEIKLEAQQ